MCLVDSPAEGNPGASLFGRQSELFPCWHRSWSAIYLQPYLTVPSQKSTDTQRQLRSRFGPFCSSRRPPCRLLLQLQRLHRHVVARKIAGHVDLPIFVFVGLGDELLGGGVAGFVELYHLVVGGEQGVAALFTFRHLQALLAVLGSEAWFSTVVGSARDVHQVSAQGLAGKSER